MSDKQGDQGGDDLEDKTGAGAGAQALNAHAFELAMGDLDDLPLGELSAFFGGMRRHATIAFGNQAASALRPEGRAQATDISAIADHGAARRQSRQQLTDGPAFVPSRRSQGETDG